MALLVQLDPGRTPEEFLEAYGVAYRTKGPRPLWAKQGGGPGASPHGVGTTIHYLRPGKYVLICLMNIPDDNPHVLNGMAKALVVTPHAGAARTPPRASIVIREVDYAFIVPASITPGHHVIKIENTGAEPHELVMIRLAPGQTVQEFMQALQAWTQNPEGPPEGGPALWAASLHKRAAPNPGFRPI